MAGLFSTEAEPFYILPSNIQRFQFLQIFANICYLFIFLYYSSHPGVCEVASHYGFDWSKPFYVINLWTLVVPQALMPRLCITLYSNTDADLNLFTS